LRKEERRDYRHGGIQRLIVREKMGDCGRRKVKVSHQFFCPITQEIMRDPVIAEDGHTYEKAVIEKWLEKSPTSPMTRQQLSSAMLIPNFALKQLIDQWKDEQRRKSKGKAKVANDEAQPPPLLPSTKPGYAFIIYYLLFI
jgi:hypothetical protein